MSGAAEPLIHWPNPILEFVGFIALFLTIGAVGLRFQVLRALRRGADDERELAASSARRAAWLGLAGAALSVALFAGTLPQMSAQRHVGVMDILIHDSGVALQGGLRVLALAGFAIAIAMPWGWILAALGVIVGVLRPALFGQWGRMLNPMHSLAGGLWIGTLFLMLVAALPGAMRVASTPERRAALTMRLVSAFSPLALGSAAVLTLFGVLTAARHLKHPSALWTTPYGITLIVKLCVVAVVFALGAWNWRRLKPRLGEPEAVPLLKRSALSEVVAAGLVLAVTAVLVSLPSP